jgi:hypothetical protein
MAARRRNWLTEARLLVATAVAERTLGRFFQAILVR